MTKITATEVNMLRKQTGAGMMDCKQALVETNGDFEKAIHLLHGRECSFLVKKCGCAAVKHSQLLLLFLLSSHL